jgi:LysR family cyn operon transcriptional activator
MSCDCFSWRTSQRASRHHQARHGRFDVSNEFIISSLIQFPYNQLMNLRHLRTFIAVVDASGVARAAARLNMTQPTATRQIEALEAEFGVPLFDRIGRRVHLTSEGEDLLVRGRRLLAEADALSERASALKRGEIGLLRIGTTPQTIESLLVDFLAQYRPRHPGIEICLIEDGGLRLPARLEQGDVHLTIMPEGDERFQARWLFPMHVIAVMASNHRLGRRDVLEVKELSDEPLLLLSRRFGSREWFNAACQIARIRPRVFIESGAPQTLIALAAGGYGIAVIPSTVLISRTRMRSVPLVHRGASIGRWLVTAWSPQRFLAPYGAQFVEELVAYTRRDYPNRDLTRRAPTLPRMKDPLP